MKFKEVVEISQKYLKEGYVTEMSIHKFLYNNFKDYIDKDSISLSNKIKKKLEGIIINFLLFTDDKTMDLKKAMDYNLKISDEAKKIYKEHKKEIDKIVFLISGQLDLKRKID